MPEDIRLYDKMRPPKKEGQPTTVFFHVTVMGLDSIDETSMVSFFFTFLINLIIFFFIINRLMPLIYFLLKHGRIID